MLIMMIVVVALMAGSGTGPMGMMMGHEKPTHTAMPSVGNSDGAADDVKSAEKSE
jgi:hypothetical protein